MLLLASLATAPEGALAAPTYAGRVASASASAASAGVTLTAGRQVAAGDAMLVALRLTGTATGVIGATDDAGNSYRADVDQDDGLSLGRLVVLSATNARSLAAGGSIRVTFPPSTGYQISVDEFTGLAAKDMNASAWGTTSSFNSGSTPATTQPVELLYGVVGNESGSAPGWSTGWTGLPTLALNNVFTTGYLDAAYRVSSSPGQFAASGSITGTWMAGIATYTAASPPDNPPAATVTVSQLASPALTVKADGSGSTDTDATPIASYGFDFGDGTAAVTTTAPTSSTQHTYAAAGTYTVTLVVTDTGGKQSSPASATITVSAADNPPVAKLTVSQLAIPALTINADGSGSTDTDATPIASYQFDFGDGTAAVTTTAPTSSTQHTYAAAGTYTVTLVVTDTGGKQSSPASATITVTAADNPPVAKLTVSQLASPALTINADGSGSTDTDATPILSYRFDFGDGTTAVTTTAATASTPHTYSAAGTYTVILVVTDTGGKQSSPASATITVTAADNPPVAKLAVSLLASPALTVNADGSGSTDTDATPIASYRFDFGDGTAAVTTTAPTASTQHTYAAAGTYTVTLVVTDTGGKQSSPATATITVSPATGAQIAVYAGYYDTHHYYNIKPKPQPWLGSPNVVFLGTPDSPSGGWDTSTIRMVNPSAGSITVSVTCDIGTHHFALWSAQAVPAGWSLIVAQTRMENFDGSETNPAGCYGCDPNTCITMVSHTIPIVNVTVNGVTTSYSDNGQILNTGGVDAAGCPATGTRNDESHAWQQIFPSQAQAEQQHDWAASPAAASGAWLGLPVPNPTRGDLMIRFRTATRGAVRVGVYDIAGRLVVPGVEGVLEAGDYNLQLNITGRAPGIYIVALSTPQGTWHRSIAYVQ